MSVDRLEDLGDAWVDIYGNCKTGLGMYIAHDIGSSLQGLE